MLKAGRYQPQKIQSSHLNHPPFTLIYLLNFEQVRVELFRLLTLMRAAYSLALANTRLNGPPKIPIKEPRNAYGTSLDCEKWYV